MAKKKKGFKEGKIKMTFLPLQESSLFHFNQIQIFINREKNLTHWNFYLLKFVISDSIFHFVFFFFFYV